ncbi:MAG: hypothetical protein KC466_14480, partial [Myxococcales bacterium]|nr:hypothetical protein [Myxococcales bacterium]
VAQRLLRRQDNGGRVPAVEYLKVTTAVSHLIRVGKPQQIYSSIETGATLGMQTFEQSLASLVKQGLVEEDDARRMSRDSKLFEDHLRAQKRGAYALTV